jgi:hypothetical protein
MVDKVHSLLAVAWVTDRSTRLSEMFPEVTSCDVTMKTNQEKRPFFMMVSKDSENKIFTNMWAFLPSQQQWVFEWLYGNAVPHLLPPEFCQGNLLGLTDQDMREYTALLNNTGPGKSLPNSTHRLCAWHKVNRGLGELRGVKSSINKRMGLAKAQEKIVHRWLYSLQDSVESKAEWDHSLTLLEYFLSQQETEMPYALGVKNTAATDRRRARESRKRRLNKGPATELSRDDLMCAHLTSAQLAWPQLNSARLTSAQLTSAHLTSAHLTLPQLASPVQEQVTRGTYERG